MPVFDLKMKLQHPLHKNKIYDIIERDLSK